MWKLIRLFSFVVFALSFSFGSELTESISLQVKVVGKIQEEKPKLLPPERLTPRKRLTYLDLSHKLLEPPKEIEEPDIVVPKEGKACGEPKDRSYYRAGIKLYIEGNLKEAESRFLDVLSLQNSAFIPQSQYFLGLIYARTGREKEAVEFLESSCNAQHPYRMPACETLYALKFKLNGKPEEVDSPQLWKTVYLISVGEDVGSVSCEDTVFKRYCEYVNSFIEGNIDPQYEESTSLRRAIVLIAQNRYEEAKAILESHNRPLNKFRNIALYYLGVIALLEGNKKEAYKYASMLEISDKELAQHLYILLSGQDILFSRIAFQVTGSKEALKNSGILYYNRGDYDLAYLQFTKAGEHLLSAYAAIRKGDYEKAYEALKKVEKRDREYYLWLLETLYWLGKDEEMEKVLSEVKDSFPELYKEYVGWLMFKKENWLEAYKYFDDPYHKALALYNSGNYKRVLEVLEGKEGLKERVLKAKAAISMGNGELARKFLKEESPEEIYLIGMSYFIEGDYAKAIEFFEKIEEGPLRSRALLRIADSYYNLGQYDKAKEFYKRILSDFPDSAEAMDATLALAQIELQNPSEDLEKLIEEFVKKFPDSPLIPDLKYQLASIYIKKGKIEEAKKILEELKEIEGFEAKALLKLAEIEENPQRKEEILKKVMSIGEKEEKERATGMLMNLYFQRKEFEKLADFLVKGDFDDRKKALEIYLSENLQKAMRLFDQLIKENPRDEELKAMALKLYDKTKGKKYLLIAKESQNPRVRARALYLLGLREKRRNKKKALEYFVEVVLTSKGIHPYYNRSIIEAANILISMKARKDASCLLEKLDTRSLSKRDLKRVKILRKQLPKCEVKR